MALIDRYIFRLTALAFLVMLAALTGVIWITQALRDFDLFTNEGQTLFVFFKLVAMLLPTLIGLIAPIALFLAILQVLYRLGSDSELIVMGAAGLRPTRLIRPMLLLTAFVAIGVSLVSLWVAPMSQRNWRDMITTARAEFISKIVREGQFNEMDNGIVFHYRKRDGDALLGLFIQDRRDANLTLVYLAERGQIVEGPSGTFLVLIDGSVQRETLQSRETSIIGFKRYALDLALLAPNAGTVTYRPRERSTQDLINTLIEGRSTRDERNEISSELTERVLAPLYAFMFCFIALAAFSRPRSAREQSWVILTFAFFIALIARLGGFAIFILMRNRPELYWLPVSYPFAIVAIAFLPIVMRFPQLGAILPKRRAA